MNIKNVKININTRPDSKPTRLNQHDDPNEQIVFSDPKTLKELNGYTRWIIDIERDNMKKFYNESW